jgi:hypothetical protein|uniref:Potassium/proton antiporter CemA n=1 Tax=Raphidocelis subcapitata TaxID=307507 RepID=A0A2Z6FBN3_9CHLO|nr:chloroplast envelope membrane protein [Raphidocelis subcapitata]
MQNENTKKSSSFFLKNFQAKLTQFFSSNGSPKPTSQTERDNFQDSPQILKNKTTNSVSLPRSTSQSSSNRRLRLNDSSKQQIVSITYEEIGLFPRSFNRVFDRFFKQLFFDVENLVIQEYRFYRYLFLTTVKCVFILLFVPLTINFLSKHYLVRPVTEYYWNKHQPEIFLNSYQQKRAFTELQEFEEKIYFESLILGNNTHSENLSKELPNQEVTSLANNPKTGLKPTFTSSFIGLESSYEPVFFSESVQNRLHEKILELAVHYNEESIESITNFFADLISFVSLCYLFFALEIQINITKSFILEVFFGLDDSKKSLFILFITDLLVGYHSPNIWELFFSSFFDHYGLPESETTIFLLVATLPVLLDVLFKYLIFRHLNRASPATVATYHAMIE